MSLTTLTILLIFIGAVVCAINLYCYAKSKSIRDLVSGISGAMLCLAMVAFLVWLIHKGQI